MLHMRNRSGGRKKSVPLLQIEIQYGLSLFTILTELLRHVRRITYRRVGKEEKDEMRENIQRERKSVVSECLTIGYDAAVGSVPSLDKLVLAQSCLY